MSENGAAGGISRDSMIDKVKENKYVCTLDEESIKTAQRDLNEIPSERESQLEEFRRWIRSHKSWLRTPMDAVFLLSFLRMRKFSQVFARQAIDHYWTTRTKYPDWLANIDTHDPAIQKVLENGSYLTLPKRDKKGRLILLGRPGVVDTSNKHYTSDDVIKTGLALSDYFLMDELTQIHGFVVLMDFTGMTMKHMGFHGMNKMKKNAAILSRIYPIRTKEVHNYNMGSVGETLFKITRPLLPEKVQKRIFTHSSLVSVYKEIDMSHLPEEYLPDDYTGPNAGPIDAIVENLRKEMSSPRVRDWLLTLSSGKFGIDESRRVRQKEIPQESFRMLSEADHDEVAELGL
ncbi:alpha-tocopherol transfer protein-like [Liolophura sinensis]|uniref:alpha-tocopherol transfer protein-like n=1 Tax=Liolophura sinensis TaxID=3198878 RepID=UPI003158344B